MKVEVRVTSGFKRLAKPLLKKYPSLKDELFNLSNELKENPKLGESLGNNAYKIRISVESKGKGKSGGLRIISYIETIILFNEDNLTEVNLLTIYDKGNTASISKNEIKQLIKNVKNQI